MGGLRTVAAGCTMEIYGLMFGREGDGEIRCLGKSITFIGRLSYEQMSMGGPIQWGARYSQMLYVSTPS